MEIRIDRRQTLRLMAGTVVAGVVGTSVAGRSARAAETTLSPITIVRDGEPAARVVVPAGADDQVRAAAETLIEYVEKSSGAVLPLVEDGQQTGTSIYVGVDPAGAGGQVAELLGGLDDDGFVIAPGDDHVTIIGPTPWGTRFGVYELLERYLGVRWLIPGPDGDTVDSRSTIAVPGDRVTDEPTFINRFISPLGPGNSWNAAPIFQMQPLWATHNRMNGTRVRYGHNLHALFPPEVFANPDDPDNYHPEFYPIRNGTTFIPSPGQRTGWQPRFSAPGIAEAAAERIIATFQDDSDPENRRSFSLGVNDGGGFSEDEVDTSHFSSVGIYSFSEPYYKFVRAVAEIVGDEFPDHTLGLLAYNSVFDPPSFALPDNVVPIVTRDRYRWVDDTYAAEDREILAKWRSVVKNLGLYDYTYGQFYATPRIYYRAQRDAYRFAADLGARYFVTELYPVWGESPKEWILARLLWNPEQEPDDLTAEWAAKAVGPRAAVHVEIFQRRWENIWRHKVPRTSWFEAGRSSMYFYFNDASYLDAVGEDDIVESRQHLERAAAKADTPARKARAGELLNTFEYYEASALSYPRPPARPSNVGEASALLESNVRSLDSAIEFAQKRATVVSSWAGDPLRSRYRSLGTAVWTGWNCYAMWELGTYIAEDPGSSKRLRDRLGQLAMSGETENIRRYAEDVLAIADGRLVALGENTSFDTGQADPWLIEHGDPLREPIRFVDEPTVKPGKALLYAGGQRAGGISQEVPVSPGFFRHSVEVYASDGSWTGGSVLPTWVLRDSEGKNISVIQGRQVPLPRAKNRWIQMVHSDMLPANVASAQCYCSVSFFSGEMTLYVDEAQFIQIASNGQ